MAIAPSVEHNQTVQVAAKDPISKIEEKFEDKNRYTKWYYNEYAREECPLKMF
jgi:hypothetical protein